MSDYESVKEAYLKVPEDDTGKRLGLIGRLNKLANTSAEITDFWKIVGELDRFLSKRKECREKILKT
ncbi:MAG: hypothetical protein WC938_03500 [Candidatus Paceibacterota bacterium]|jgi:hypothetical protein